ncbi:MAG: MmgE/PrpD family protein [Pseudomonadota bacterium]
MENSELRQAAGQGLRTFVEWAVRQELTDIPAHARQKAVMIIADDMAAMLSAEHEPQIVAAQARLAERGTASLFRRDRAQLSVAQAALGNALSASWNELDEGYRKAVCHAGLYTLPALLAIAESDNLPASEVIRASTLAYETTARFAKTWRFESLRIHPHALFCAVGVTAAVGFIRRLPAGLMLSALANASTLGVVGPYNQAVRGALIRNAWAAAGINNGFHAIEWAQAGISGLPETPHDVYFETLGSEANIAELTADLGTEWAVASGYHKINACCQYAHSSIEAMQQILREQPALLGGAGVDRIRIETHRLGMTLDDHQPVTTLGAKFSLPHALAASLVYGHGGAEAFGSEAVQDERVARLRGQVEMRLVPEELPWPQDRPAFVTLVGADGQTYSANCLSARGGPDRPFGDQELWDKIAGLSQASAPGLAAAMRQLHALAGGSAADAQLAQPWRQWVDRFFDPAATRA